MDIPMDIPTGTAFAQWIKDVSKDLEVMRTNSLDLSSSERDQRIKKFILDQLSTAYQAVYKHFAHPDNIMSSLKDDYSNFYFSQVSDPDTEPLSYPSIQYPPTFAELQDAPLLYSRLLIVYSAVLLLSQDSPYLPFQILSGPLQRLLVLIPTATLSRRPLVSSSS
eukprot:gene30745-35781_t